MFRKAFTSLIPLAALILLTPHVHADLVVEFTAGADRGGGDFSQSTLADFQVADPLLDAGTPVTNAPGNSGFGDISGTTLNGITITTNGGGLSFAAGGAAHNNTTQISDTYIFFNTSFATPPTITFSGLAAAAPAGSQIDFTLWAIGDNEGQQGDFTATYGSDVQFDRTRYNDGPSEPRSSAVGSIPFVSFNFTADGVTDTLDLTSATTTFAEGGNFINLNGFSVSISPVPEPSSLVLLGLSGLGLIRRKRS